MISRSTEDAIPAIEAKIVAVQQLIADNPSGPWRTGAYELGMLEGLREALRILEPEVLRDPGSDVG